MRSSSGWGCAISRTDHPTGPDDGPALEVLEHRDTSDRGKHVGALHGFQRVLQFGLLLEQSSYRVQGRAPFGGRSGQPVPFVGTRLRSVQGALGKTNLCEQVTLVERGNYLSLAHDRIWGDGDALYDPGKRRSNGCRVSRNHLGGARTESGIFTTIARAKNGRGNADPDKHHRAARPTGL